VGLQVAYKPIGACACTYCQSRTFCVRAVVWPSTLLVLHFRCMKAFLFLIFFLLFMGKRLCPCVPCESNPVVDNRTWSKHAGEIARGVRQRLHVAVAQRPPLPVDNSPPVDDLGGAEELDQTTLHYAMEMSELVATGSVKATGMEAVLKSTSRWFQPHLPIEVTVPKSWHRAKNMAVKGKKPVSFTRDFCPGCDHLFAVTPSDVDCPRCNNATRYTDGVAARQGQYFDVDDKCIRLFATQFTASRTLPPTDQARPSTPMANRELHGVFDGSILEALYHKCPEAYKEFCLFFALSNDGVEVTKKTSYTPIVAQLLNLPAEMRGLLSSMWLLGYMPPNVKDYQAFLKPIADMFAARAPLTGVPLEVYNAAKGQEDSISLMLAWSINDIRAVPSTTCGSNPPCYVGSCNMCVQQGIRLRGQQRTILPGAVRALGAGACTRAHVVCRMHTLLWCVHPAIV